MHTPHRDYLIIIRYATHYAWYTQPPHAANCQTLIPYHEGLGMWLVYTPDTTDLRNLLISHQLEDVLSENESERKSTTCVTWPRQHLALTAVATAPQSTQAAALLGLGHGGSGSRRFCILQTSFPPHSQRKHLLVVEHILQVPSHLFSCTHEPMRENGELNGVQFCSDVLQTLPSNLCTTVMALCCDPRSKVEGQRPTWILMSPYRVILALQPGSTRIVLWVESTMQIIIRVTW